MPTLQGNKKIIPTKVRLYSLRRLLSICTSILEQLQSGATEQKSKEKLNSEKEKANSCKKSQASTSDTNVGRKNKQYAKMGTHEV